MTRYVHGHPPRELWTVAPGAVQASPRIPGAVALEEAEPGSASEIVIEAPPGTLERRFVLAAALRALAPGGQLVAMAAKDRGGLRLRAELEAFGCTVDEQAKRHARLCTTLRPDQPTGVEHALAAGGPQFVEAMGLWSQPGVFQWDRIDPGTAMLAQRLDGLAGRGIDLGCGAGALGRALLEQARVTALCCVDVDRRAIAAARRNLDDMRVRLLWADALRADLPGENDFVAMNPPFHDGAREDRALGQGFIRRAASLLRKGGVLRLVANQGLPYEATLREAFSSVHLLAASDGYKVMEAVK